MSRFVRPLLIACALALAPFGLSVVQAQGNSASVDAATPGAALAQIMYPRDVYVEQSSRSFAKMLEMGLRSEPVMVVYIARNPDFLDFIKTETVPRIAVLFDDSYSDYVADVGVRFDKHFTTREIAQMQDFFSTPAGRAFVNLSVDSADINPDTLSQVMDGETVSGRALTTLNEEHFNGRMLQLPEDQLLQIVDFSLSSAGRKFGQIGPELEQGGLDFGMRLAERNDDVIERIMGDAVDKYMAQRNAKAEAN